MKKMTVVIFTIMSALGFSETYKITPGQGVKVSEKELKNNSEKIERAIIQAKARLSDKSMLDNLLSSIRKFKFPNSKIHQEILQKEIFNIGMEYVAVKNMDIEIKDMEYVEKDKVDVGVKVKYGQMEDNKNYRKRAREIFQRKTGIDPGKIPEEQRSKYLVEAIEAGLIAYDEEFSKLPRNMEKEITVTVSKEKNKWEVDLDNLIYELLY